MFRAYKYRLYPTESQKVLIAKTFGCCRYVYNKALALKMAYYAEKEEGLSVFALDKAMTDWKETEAENWLNEVNSQSLQQSLRHLDAAYTSFFKKTGGFPKFKAKGNHDSFSNPQSTKVDFERGWVRIPKFKGGIKCRFHRTFEGLIKTSTISRTPSGKYYISILVDDGKPEPVPAAPAKNQTLGIDLGIKDFATFSDGAKVANPKHLSKKAKKLARAQRQMSRKAKGSKNRNKARLKVAKLHEKVSACRTDFLHKLTHSLIENQDYNSFAIEDLSVKSMMENGDKNMSRNIGDVGWATFRTFLEYKAKRKGKNVLVIGRFEPSSRLCNCGFHNSLLTLNDRTWTCPSCGKTHDRDVLAARNIVKFAFLRQDTNVSTKAETLAKLSDPSGSVTLPSERGELSLESFSKAPPKKRNKRVTKPVESLVRGSVKQEASELTLG